MPAESPMIRHRRSRGIRRWLPGFALLANYNSATFGKDLLAGAVLASLLAPVGMGYAEAAGLPAIYGLYATIIPLLVYAIFGPSRILIIGPDSALTALIAATIIPLSMGDPIKAASLAAALAIMSGAICIFAGFARLGFITDLLSKPIRYGYMNGIALSLLVGQLPKLFGFTIHGDTTVQISTATLCALLEGKINPATCLLGFSCLALILAARRWFPRVPAVFLAVVGASLAVAAAGPGSAIPVVGPLPQGLPVVKLPVVSGEELAQLLNASLALALVSIADMSVLSRIYALRGGYYVDENQE
ncbi:MAG: SulP family inorganic anion transporter, partial [Geobacter sp.]|nr:SulP family inorganic anion transporter [Geobacter sp.]